MCGTENKQTTILVCGMDATWNVKRFKQNHTLKVCQIYDTLINIL